MKLIIAGSRILNNYPFITQLINSLPKDVLNSVEEVVSGGAKGVDAAGELWSLYRGIPVKVFPPDWDGLGKKAGFVRNKQMAEYADALLAVRINHSKGTTHMIETMQALDKPTFVVDINFSWS